MMSPLQRLVAGYARCSSYLILGSSAKVVRTKGQTNGGLRPEIPSFVLCGFDTKTTDKGPRTAFNPLPPNPPGTTLNPIDIRCIPIPMSQITTRLPDELIKSLEEVASKLKRPRAEIVRQALERYLEDYQDLDLAVERLRDPADPVLDWNDVKRELLDQD